MDKKERKIITWEILTTLWFTFTFSSSHLKVFPVWLYPSFIVVEEWAFWGVLRFSSVHWWTSLLKSHHSILIWATWVPWTCHRVAAPVKTSLYCCIWDFWKIRKVPVLRREENKQKNNNKLEFIIELKSGLWLSYSKTFIPMSFSQSAVLEIIVLFHESTSTKV